MGELVSISVVGSTGSVGSQALDVIRAEPGRFRVECIGAFRNVDLLVAQAVEFRPRVVAVGDDSQIAAIRDRLPPGTDLVGGPRAMAEIANEADVCVNGVVGFAGLPVTLAALAGGRRLALANKESLITAGPIVAQVKRTPGAEIVPVDSEHCAVHQCLASHRTAQALGAPDRLRRIVLTASGGPFRTRAHEAGGGAAAREALARVTVDEALAHPTWKMGPKITVDSSTKNGPASMATARFPEVNSPAGKPRLADCKLPCKSITVRPLAASLAGSSSIFTARPGPPIVVTSRVPLTRFKSASMLWATRSRS